MHAEAAKKLGSALKSAGLRVEVSTPSWWSTPVSIFVPAESYKGMYDMAVTAQHSPNGGYVFAISIMGPMSRNKTPDALAPFQTWKSSWSKLVSLFGKYGKATLPVRKDDQIQLWVEVPDDKVEKLISDGPGLMRKVADVVAPPIVALKK